ncbi:MAG: LysM peptidoglycan-binding domain-containing protein [Verrucomicrobiales bacterium]|jgi:tetratricopeptide (TPR) repeat protein|nr:LysM peptidoglycan-binding domain-containing protein [Verrucomicrobiales bacterium]
MKPYLLLLTLALPLLTTACYQKGTDAEDTTNPYFAQAEKFESEENYNAAIEQYEKALQANGAVVKAYEKMGDLYSEKLGDPISAIYCYQKYLKARPNADDKDLVANYIDKAKHDFALTLPQTAAPAVNGDLSQAGAPGAMATTSGSGMNMTVSVPTSTAPASAAPATNAPTAAPATAVPAPNTQGAKTYTIQKGDSLWKIAKKFYPEDVKGGVEKIKQANPQTAANDKGLKLGATLIIP